MDPDNHSKNVQSVFVAIVKETEEMEELDRYLTTGEKIPFTVFRYPPKDRPMST